MLSFYLSLVLTDGDRDKLTRLYEKNYGTMMFVAEKILGEKKSAAPDIVHGSILRIINNLDRLDLSDDLKTRNLCLIIVRHGCFDYLSSAVAKIETLDEDEFPETGGSVEEITVSDDSVAGIVAAIRSLDKKYVGVCMLKFVYGYGNREIAEMLGLNESTVGTRIGRARKILRATLGKENEG